MKNIPDLSAKLQALFHFTSSILHRLRWSSTAIQPRSQGLFPAREKTLGTRLTAIFKAREAHSFLVLIE